MCVALTSFAAEMLVDTPTVSYISYGKQLVREIIQTSNDDKITGAINATYKLVLSASWYGVDECYAI